MEKLEVGEKYLSISLSAERVLFLAHKAIVEGKDNIQVAAFKNVDRKDQQPHYKSKGVSVWISKKKDFAASEVEEELI